MFTYSRWWTVPLNKVVYIFQMVDRLDAQEGGQTEIKQESAIQVKQILHVKSPKWISDQIAWLYLKNSLKRAHCANCKKKFKLFPHSYLIWIFMWAYRLKYLPSWIVRHNLQIFTWISSTVVLTCNIWKKLNKEELHSMYIIHEFMIK